MSHHYFEVHVTVRTSDVEQFKHTCAAIGVKPIVLEFQAGDDQWYDVMTSQTYFCTSEAIQRTLQQTVELLTTAGFNVIRAKCEVDPNHPDVPTRCNGKQMEGFHHFEVHLQVLVNNPNERALIEMASEVGGHLSRNTFKRYNDKYVQMLTVRSHDLVREDFEELVDRTVARISETYELVPDKCKIEYAWIDTNIGHDQMWLSK